ncbi:hypothetical protein GBA52_028064 [Prunus armeniaca]|nr:hypothetical protein GBA52_028064 [Prunus armeniaca]
MLRVVGDFSSAQNRYLTEALCEVKPATANRSKTSVSSLSSSSPPPSSSFSWFPNSKPSSLSPSHTQPR